MTERITAEPEGDEDQVGAREWGYVIEGVVTIPEGVLEAAGLDVWQHTPAPRYTVKDCCRAVDYALPILLPTITDQVLETLAERLTFAGYDDVVLIEEDEQGDPVTVGEWIKSYRQAERENAR